MRTIKLLMLAVLVWGFVGESRPADRAEPRYDTVILGGRVIDPETATDAVLNVGIIDGTIAIVTDQAIRGRRKIAAQGLVVAPGFIDLHAHGQSVAADRMQAFDGVTTALELESGILPIDDWYRAQGELPRVLNYGASAAWTFARIAELEGLDPEADLRWFQKAFSLKNWVETPASQEQVDRIVSQVEQGILDGAIGIGINAGYAPGGGYKELLAIHALAARHGVPTFTHISSDYPDDPDSAAENIGKIISFSAATGSQAHVCHLNSSSLKDIETTSAMIRSVQEQGLPITVEAYTYGASSTTIGSALFSEKSMERKSIEFSQIELNGVPLDEQTFTETRANNPGAIIVFRFLDMPADAAILDRSVLFPGGAIASDAMPWVYKQSGEPVDDAQWPLADRAFAHPRSAGTYTRLLSQWVRERNALSLSEAIRKSSLIPAQILEQSVPQMTRKGRIQEGMDADIIVFDAETVQDKATFVEPNQPAQGMYAVLVNGTPVIEAGQLVLEADPGRAIRRDLNLKP